MNIIIQLFSILALISYLCSHHQKTKKKILIYQTLSYFCYMVVYLLLHAYTAAAISFLSFLRSIAFQKERKENTFFLFLLVAALIPIQIVTYDGLYSLFPTITTIIMNYALWQKNMTVLRFFFFANAIGWLSYNIIVGAYIVVFGNVLEIISSTIAIIKFDILAPISKIKQKNKPL